MKSMINLVHLKIRSFSWAAQRWLYRNPPETPQDEAQKKLEKDASQPSEEAKITQHSPQDLEDVRRSALVKLEGKIKHPDVLKDAIGRLDAELKPIKDRLVNLPIAQEHEKEAIAGEVNNAVESILSLSFTFKDFIVDGKKFELATPVSVDRYENFVASARKSLATMQTFLERDKAKGIKVDDSSLKFGDDGFLEFQVAYPRNRFNLDAEEGEYHVVRIQGNKIEEEIRTVQTDYLEKTAVNFRDAFDAWKEKNTTWDKDHLPPQPNTFTFKDADGHEKTFDPTRMWEDLQLDPQKTPADFREFMASINTNLIGAYDLQLRDLFAQTKQTRRFTYNDGPDGKKYVQEEETINASIVTGKETKTTLEKDSEGNVVKEVRQYVEIVAQQARNITIETFYHKAEAGQPLRRLRSVKYKDGIIQSSEVYDGEGDLRARFSFVEGCPDIRAVDRPTGKMLDAKDDHGRRIFETKDGKKFVEDIIGKEKFYTDEKGNCYRQVEDPAKPGTFYYDPVVIKPDRNDAMSLKVERKMDAIPVDDVGAPQQVPETLRTMTLADGTKITSYDAMKKEKGEKFSQEDYIKFLAKHLQSPQEWHAFSQLMMKYVYDYKNGVLNEDLQTWNQTVNRTEGGRMCGDCEDWAFLFKKIKEAQGQVAYVVAIPGHAECITLEKNPDGGWTATSIGTFGFDQNGNRVGGAFDAQKAKGYATPYLALASLSDKWSARSSGNPKMKNGNIVKFDRGTPKIKVLVPGEQPKNDLNPDHKELPAREEERSLWVWTYQGNEMSLGFFALQIERQKEKKG